MSLLCRKFPCIGFRARAPLVASCLLLFLLPAAGQDIDLTLTTSGSAATGRPLPVGAMPRLTITIRNAGKGALAPSTLIARHDGLTPANSHSWRSADETSISKIPRLSAGERAERILRFRVDQAPYEPVKKHIRIEVRGKGGVVAEADFELRIADCVGAYRARLQALRPNLLQEMRETAEAMRKPDPALPPRRLFPATGARKGDLAAAERLAASFAARRGADAEMGTEWFRFLIRRWSSELNNYTGQAANPGLCANNKYQIAGYRQGLLPITKRIDAIQAAATNSFAAASEAMRGETAETVAELVQHFVSEFESASDTDTKAPLAALAAMRASRDRIRNLARDEMRQLSLAETAAWLDLANGRGQALTQAIERVLSTIATARKESCVCAY